MHSKNTAAKNYVINTSNPQKLKELKHCFGQFNIGLTALSHDLPEVLGDPLEVIRNKLTQLPDAVLAEDTVLDIFSKDGDGREKLPIGGVSIKFTLANGQFNQDLLGCPVTWTVLIGQRRGAKVWIATGQVSGKIVAPRGVVGGFGFDPYFLPHRKPEEENDQALTLAESKPNQVSARYQAVAAFCSGIGHTHDLLSNTEWESAGGRWQNV